MVGASTSSQLPPGVGRPLADLTNASAKTKRRRVDDLIKSRSSEELTAAAEISSRLSGKRNVAKLIKGVSESTEKFTDFQKCSEQHKQQRSLTSEEALAYYVDSKSTNEKIFTVEESYNKQNDKVYAHSSEEASNRIPRVQRGHFSSSLMVWLGVSYWGLNRGTFLHWVFQQDSAPAHRAKSTQDWQAAREIDFIRHEDWPSSSPDLNPLDYKIWQHLEEKACSKPHPNLESLKTSLIKAAADIDMDL
ncbi:uncharacterized protein LOC113238779, partial [Hyposmocoma kahamanoa]|uniref:uncharacterized protein LOC113238779 n=1 Tax=Hyposmocoma kahamanoa TaxID=1477025 RepID=UPI000E6D7ABF